MPARFAAFLRAVTPANCKMPALQRAFEEAGFTDVRTVLSSGNVVFDAPARSSEGALARKAEEAMQRNLGRTFVTLVRTVDALEELLARDPFTPLALPANAKRVVTFLAAPPPRATVKALPVTLDGAHIVAVEGTVAFAYYVPSPRGPAFMTLIERTFGTDVTTRTWDTVHKVVAAARRPR
jgi:uncharacterized protein (DUF1697 family)